MSNDDNPKGLSRGLTNYGDKDFSLYLRRSFAKSMGYSDESLFAHRGDAAQHHVIYVSGIKLISIPDRPQRRRC